MDQSEIIEYIKQCRETSKSNKQARATRNRINWNMYNLKQDYSKKKKGQSKEFIPKLNLGIKYFKSMLSSGLTNRSDDWYMVQPGAYPDDVFNPWVVYVILQHYLYHANAKALIPEIGKYVALDATNIVKVGGEVQKIPFAKNLYKKLDTEHGKVETKEVKGYKEDIKERWRLTWDIINFNDWYPDTESNPCGLLYNIHEIEMDLYKLKALAKDYPDHYKAKEINKITESFTRQDEKTEKDLQLNKSTQDPKTYRKRVVLTEFWGDLINKDGELDQENVLCILANDKYLIRGPEENYRYDGQDPLVFASLFPTEHTAIATEGLADAPAELNKMYNEATNLFIDGMFSAIKGVYQYRKGWATKPHQLSKGISNGMTIEVSRDMPLGVQVVERIALGSIPQDAYAFYKEMDQAVNESMLMNDLKMGNIPQAVSTKATAMAIADQTSSGMFSSLFTEFEDNCIVPLLEKSWCEILQNMDSDTLGEELVYLVGKETAAKIKAMTPRDRYLKGANAAKFVVRGISGHVQRIREFQKMNMFMNTIFSNPVLAREVMKDYSIPKIVGQVLAGAGIREDQVKLSQAERSDQYINAAVGQALAKAQGGQSQEQPQPQGGNAGAPEPDINAQPMPMEGNSGSII